MGSAKNLNLNLVQKELLTLEHNVLLPIYIIAHRYAILGILSEKYLKMYVLSDMHCSYT